MKKDCFVMVHSFFLCCHPLFCSGMSSEKAHHSDAQGKASVIVQRLAFKMQRALVILTSSAYGNKIQTLCESVGEKLSRPLEGGDHFLHGFFSRITSE